MEKIDFEESNRVVKECRYAGGKGIDVSKVLTHLGLPNVALGFIGGYTGDELECRLTNEGVRTDFIRISNETRTNIIVHESSTGRQFLLNAAGPEICPYELGLLLKRIEGLKDPAILAMGGSIPPGVHPGAYRRIISVMRERRVPTILDADGEALRIGIQGGPDYIKPNLHELGKLVGRKLTKMVDILEAAEEVRSMGVGTVLVSMSAKGIMMVGENVRLWAAPPKVKVVNTVGVGDASVAGFIYGLMNGSDPKHCLAYAVASGTATTLKPGTAQDGKDNMLGLLPRIEFKNISRSETDERERLRDTTGRTLGGKEKVRG